MSAVIQSEGHELSELELRAKIVAFEDVLKTMPQIDIPVEHFFAPGVYVRQIRIPKDTWMTGSIYKESSVHTVLKGKMAVVTDRGMKTVEAPCTFVSPPNVKRAGYAYEDTIWQAAFPNPDNETDPDKIMAKITTEVFAIEGSTQ